VQPQASADALPLQPAPAKKRTQPALQTPSTAEGDVAPAAPTPNAPLEPGLQSTESDDNSTETSPPPRFDLSTQTASVDPAQLVAGRGYAEEQPTTTARAQEDMPLIWPVSTAADQTPIGGRPEFTVSFPQVGAFLTAVLGLAVIVGRMIFKLSANRRSRSQARKERGAARVAGKPGRGPSTNTASAPRAARLAPSAHDLGVDYEARVRRLLHELQQRHHKERPDPVRTMLERAGSA
jgi:hypothetical protein